MNILCRLLIIFACAIVLVSAGDRGSPLDEIDLETGKIIKAILTVAANNDVSKQQGSAQVTARDAENALQELSTGRRSDDVVEDNAKDKCCWLCSSLTKKRLYYVGATASCAVSLGLIIYDCGYSACDPSGGMMVATYVFSGLGAAFATGGYCTFSEQNRESLLN